MPSNGERRSQAKERGRDLLRLPTVRVDQGLYGAVLVLLALAPLMRGWRFVRDDVVLIMPDLNETWLSVQAAGHLDQNVGPWSRIGLFHPGPMWFYWCAPFLRLSGGRPAGLFLAALALSSVCAVVTVEQVRRALGISAGLVAAVVVAGVFVLLDPTGLAFPWNPTVLIMPVLAAGASVALAGSGRSIGAACTGIVFSWFVVQTHLGALPLGAALLLASVILAGRAIGREWRQRLGWIATTSLCLLVPLIPIARDQVSGTQNATTVARYVATGEVSRRFPEDPPSENQHLGLSAVLRESAAITTLVQGDIARWAGADLLLAREHRPMSIAPLVLFALVIGAVLASVRLVRPHRRSEDFLGWMGLVALGGTVIQTIVAIRARDEFRPYLIAASAGVGGVLWLVAALQIQVVLVQRLRASTTHLARQTIRGAVALSLMVPLWLFMRAPLEGVTLDLRSADGASQAIAQSLPTRHVRVQVDRIGTMAESQRLVAALERDGMSVTVEGREVAHFSDRQRRTDPEAVRIVVTPVNEVPPSIEPLAMVEGFAVVAVAE